MMCHEFKTKYNVLLKLEKLFNFGTLIFSLALWYKFIFNILSLWLKEERDLLSDFDGRERNILSMLI